MGKDILLNDNDEPIILSGDFVIGESEMQEVYSILRAKQGEFKSDPILGTNLHHYMKGKYERIPLEKNIKIQLERDGKNYDKVKKQINPIINNGR